MANLNPEPTHLGMLLIGSCRETHQSGLTPDKEVRWRAVRVSQLFQLSLFHTLDGHGYDGGSTLASVTVSH